MTLVSVNIHINIATGKTSQDITSFTILTSLNIIITINIYKVEWAKIQFEKMFSQKSLLLQVRMSANTKISEIIVLLYCKLLHRLIFESSACILIYFLPFIVVARPPLEVGGGLGPHLRGAVGAAHHHQAEEASGHFLFLTEATDSNVVL